MNIRKDDLVSFTAFTLTLFSRQAVKHFRSTLIIHHVSLFLSFSVCVRVSAKYFRLKTQKRKQRRLTKICNKRAAMCVTLLTLHFRYRQRNYYYKDLQDKFQKRLRMTVSYFVSRSRKWTQTKKKGREKKKILNDDDEITRDDEICLVGFFPSPLYLSFNTWECAHTGELGDWRATEDRCGQRCRL